MMSRVTEDPERLGVPVQLVPAVRCSASKASIK